MFENQPNLSNDIHYTYITRTYMGPGLIENGVIIMHYDSGGYVRLVCLLWKL